MTGTVNMLEKNGPYFEPRRSPAPSESEQLQELGYTVLEAVFSSSEVGALRDEIDQIYETCSADRPGPDSPLPAEEQEDFRYEMLNRSPLSQRAIANSRILNVIEPLLGPDCHVIANTCWRNPPRASNLHGGGYWHIDSGPHVPRQAGIRWPDDVPYPVFAIGAHILLKDCPRCCGPTGVLPGSHKSGQFPPKSSKDIELTWEGNRAVSLEGQAGDVALFVSDVWHRRLPSEDGDGGRFFLQVHYGRRDIAQRLRVTSQANHLSQEAIDRAQTPREKTLIGLHAPFFYDG